MLHWNRIKGWLRDGKSAADKLHTGQWSRFLLVAGLEAVRYRFVIGVVVVGAVALLGLKAMRSSHPKPEAARSAEAGELPAIALLRDNLEFPPVGPTKAAAGDQVAQVFKTARAACADARKKARAKIGVQWLAKSAELKKSKASPEVLEDFDHQWTKYSVGPGRMEGSGPLPTHPAMQAAVADYWKAMDEATRQLGGAAEAGLAAYQRAGVTDPAKLRPLQAARLAARNTALIGIWGTSRGYVSKYTWIVEVDEATGRWRADGIVDDIPGAMGGYFYAEDIQFRDGKLAFKSSPVDTDTRKVKPGGRAASLKLQDGKLLFETVNNNKEPVTKTLLKTGDEMERSRIDFRGIRKDEPFDSAFPADTPDLADANYVWRRLAALSSFPAYLRNFSPGGGEQQYIPIRSSRPTLSRGTYAGLADMLGGRAPGRGENHGQAEALFREFDVLGDSPHPYLQRAAGEFLALSRARFQLAEADELFGNTPNSSIREFQQKVFIPAGRYVYQRELDRVALQEKLEKKYPEYRVIVEDAPLSEASRERLNETLDGFVGLLQDLKKRFLVSGLLAYADMAQVDRATRLWQAWLLPLAKRSGGPASTTPLVTVGGEWKAPFVDGPDRFFYRLKEFQLKNVSGQDLTHVAVEVIAENEWGEKAVHYYYFHQLEVAEVARLVPHPRWQRRRLPFTNRIKVRWSVWADQGSEVDRQAELTNPTPNTNSKVRYRDFVKYDQQYQAEGEALGAIVRNFQFLPIKPERQRRRLLRLATPGSSYAVRLGDSENPLVIRFLRLDAAMKDFEIEVIDAASRKPFRPKAPVCKGTLRADKVAGYAIGLDLGWTLLLAHDDQLTLSVPTSDGSPPKNLPLVRVKQR